MKAVKITNLVAFILLVIGGLNWLLIGVFDFNLVTAITGGVVALYRTIYSLVGLGTLWLIISSIWTKHIGFPVNEEPIVR